MHRTHEQKGEAMMMGRWMGLDWDGDDEGRKENKGATPDRTREEESIRLGGGEGYGCTSK